MAMATVIRRHFPDEHSLTCQVISLRLPKLIKLTSFTAHRLLTMGAVRVICEAYYTLGTLILIGAYSEAGPEEICNMPQ